MNKTIFILTLLIISKTVASQIIFDDYFYPYSLRFDYIHAGNSTTEYFFIEQLKREPYWGGTKTKLIDPLDYGQYKIEVYDSSSGKLIYSRGYCTLFEEWKTTTEAKTISRSFYESQQIPFPKKTIIIQINGRNTNGIFIKHFQYTVNPTDQYIKNEALPNFKTNKIIYSGEPSLKVDVVIIPDGYTKNEMEKFSSDANRFASYLFNSSPFKENKNKFNIWAIEVPSQETGTDIPNVTWRNTAVNTSFYTLGSERYLMTYDIKTIRDIAALTPYDQIYILVNTSKYGGGGIYNYYSVCISDNEYSEFVFIHEFGHAFAGLGDEYYTSEVTYNEFINLAIEPWQPNLTTMVNFEKKWKNMLDKNTPIPTPAETSYNKTLGVYEGGGYTAKGVFRPYIDCTMKSRIVDGFCPVCKKNIIEMINYYTK